ncbi:MAG: DUF1684 domain-containing protein [Flavobacteriaceae bacterium]|nr:DUF1684 domain-containing protein [Bacteroidia bacterium]NNK71425.1 DUF1684 domain-containing protein [Flavobacteriaceae bacterium]
MDRFFSLIIIFFFIGCDSGKQPIQGKTDWQRDLNAMFKDASRSPLSDSDRKSFKGLPFFPIDSNYIVKADLKRTPDSPFFRMKTSTDDINMERVYGILNFELNGQAHQLEVYQGEEALNSMDNKDYLFLPFLDDTNAETTYGGGRYIDLRIPERDTIIIDFNKAYNPYCAYNENYSCPIVPRKNYIETAVEAGVKLEN